MLIKKMNMKIAAANWCKGSKYKILMPLRIEFEFHKQKLYEQATVNTGK